MMEDYVSIMKNDAWGIVSRPEGKLVMSSRWIFKIKYVVDDSVEKYKVRFVDRGFF